MLYMIVEHLKDAEAVYARFGAQGRLLPGGLQYVASWVTPDRTRCYQLMETEERGLIDVWMARWSDLVEFEVWPVTASGDVSQVARK